MTNGFLPVAAACFLVMLILFYNKIIRTVQVAILSMVSPVRAREMGSDASFKAASIISFIFCIPLFSYCLFSCGISNLSFGMTMLVIGSLLLFRFIVDILLSFLNNEYKVMEETRQSDNTFVLITFLSLPAIITQFIAADTNGLFSEIWIGIIASLFVIIRYLEVIRKFLSMKFSHFFAFLYLCGLKFLPIAVAVKILVF